MLFVKFMLIVVQKNPSILRNTDRVDFVEKILDNVQFIKVNGLPAV